MKKIWLALNFIVQLTLLFFLLYLCLALCLWFLINQYSLAYPPWPILEDGKLSSDLVTAVHSGAAMIGAAISLLFNLKSFRSNTGLKTRFLKNLGLMIIVVAAFTLFGKALFHSKENWERHPSRLFALKAKYGPSIDICQSAKLGQNLNELAKTLSAGTLYKVASSNEGVYCPKLSHCSKFQTDPENKLTVMECWDGRILSSQ